MRLLPILILLLTSNLINAQTVKLTGTGLPDLDGDYQLAGTLNDRPRYTKTVGQTTYTIFCRRDGKASVWMIEDDKQNNYFGTNAATAEPPLQGWDVGRAGKDLNANFSLLVDKSPVAASASEPQTITIRLANNRNTTQRIIVRTLLGGKETVRARTYQPAEVYEYQVANGTQLYLLTEQEGDLLMSGKGNQVSGRLLLTADKEIANKTYQAYQN
ncbi:hypothetical protein DYU11_32195 [Fibrisoma montanum]|uniref:Uncharacterized protein n=1 Tax=Fibrisoma montanum TaxID=2305895 RepID=A0A418LVS4_9BACT|nr:hypothetical protein [Fibrisoma montanum]RIV17351.1 hypothetical protein DYU11_32195 [Fibrisoma montanum]